MSFAYDRDKDLIVDTKTGDVLLLLHTFDYLVQRADPAFTVSDARNGSRSLVGSGMDYRFALALVVLGLIMVLGPALAR